MLLKLKPGRLKRIHVNQPNLRANAKDSGDRPVFSIQTSHGVLWGHHVITNGPSEVVFRERPLSCGARCWVETRAEVVISVGSS